MNWEDLRYVLAISRGHTLSRAAALLGTAHTTVGRRLRSIEKALGVRLFDQKQEGLFPTAAGEDLLGVAARMEAEVLSLEGRLVGRDVRMRGKLRVTTMDLLFRRYSEGFASFLTRYPSVELTLSMSDTEALLHRREADIALRLTNTPPDTLFGRKIGQVEFAVYGSKELARRIGEGAPYERFPWVHWDERLQMSWLDSWLARFAPGAKIAMRVEISTLALQEVLASGVGVHFLSTIEGDADPRLQRLGEVDPSFSREVWLLTLPELRRNLRVRGFIEHMETFSLSRHSLARSSSIE